MKELEVYEPIVISNIYDLKRMCWSGAIQRIDKVLEMSEEKQDAFLQHVIDYGELMGEMDILTTTDINDFIWFECDEFIEELKENQDINYKNNLENRIDIDYVIGKLEDIEPNYETIKKDDGFHNVKLNSLDKEYGKIEEIAETVYDLGF